MGGEGRDMFVVLWGTRVALKIFCSLIDGFGECTQGN
jgi:hypothetical protein